jgi:hypothetical protein
MNTATEQKEESVHHPPIPATVTIHYPDVRCTLDSELSEL